MTNREPIPEYGDVYTAEAFMRMHNAGAILPYDGCGNWATDTEMGGESCFSPQPEWATHVVWFNR